MASSNFVSAWRGFGSSTAIFALVIAVIGSAIDHVPVVSIIAAIGCWGIVNAGFVLFYWLFKKPF